MKKVGQKVLAVLLCVCMVFSCMTISVSALTWEVVFAALANIGTVYGALSTLAGLYYKEPNIIMDSIRDDIYGKTSNFLWCVPSAYLNSASTRIEIPYTSLSMISQDWNLNYSGAGFDFPCQLVKVSGADGKVYTVIKLMQMQDRQDTTGRTKQAWFLGDGSGRILCSTEPINAAGTWIAVNKLKSPYNMVSLEALYDMAKGEGGTVRKSGEMYFVMNPLKTQVLAASDGHAYAAWANEEQSAINQDRPMAEGSVTNNITNNNTTENITNNYISNTQIDEGDTFYTYNTENNTYNTTNETYETIINNIKEGDTYYIKEGDTYYEVTINDNDYSLSIDIGNMTMVGEGGVINNIDSLLYDSSTKQYFLSTFFGAGDTYEYNYYTYEYHINYTSVTYIGYTEQYDKHYELYYQLPDGRSSADLTVADLEQLSTSFKDVVNYARSADDLSQRALYHFDGNTEDSSYWSYCTDFIWTKGASLTYMDEGTFGGSLYLDETEHDFTLTLPANDAAGDWTMQFRYYQSHTESPTLDSYITVGGVNLFQFDGDKYYNGSGTAITATSVGSWNEICLMRKDGTLYYYINGVPYGSMAASIGTSAVRFYFGATQRTYKKLDELRFTRGAIYEPGKGYTPTSVPYDSNLSLVLPDGKVPLADEVMVLRPSGNNLLTQKGLDDWTNSSVLSRLTKHTSSKQNFSVNQKIFDNAGVSLFYNEGYSTLVYGDAFVSLTCAGVGANVSSSQTDVYSYKGLANGIFLPVCTSLEYMRSSLTNFHYTGKTLYSVDKDYTLSVVLADGSYSSFTFKVSADTHSGRGTSYSAKKVSSDISSTVGVLAQTLCFTNNDFSDYGDYDALTIYGIRFYPATAGATADIIYVELVEGSAPEWSISYEGAVYDPGELEESPVLAVRSNTPISTYQIGGVRPSYPKKGQVYAMVENGYITSLQQYTGSAWEAVDGRIWTGSRWIPASSYNVITLQDMYDIVDATPDYEYIYTESGFWDWFQRAWKDLLARLDKIIDGQKGSGGGTALDPEDDTMLPSVEDNPETETDEGWGAFDLLIVIKDGTWSIITGVVKTGFDGLVGLANGFTYITGFFNAYDANSPDNVLGFTNYGGADIWD